MNAYKNIIIIAVMASPTVANAIPFSDVELNGSFRWAIDENRIAQMDIRSSTAFAQSTDGRNSASSKAMVIATTVYSKDQAQATDFTTQGSAETSAFMDGYILTATARTFATASGTSEINAVYKDGSVGLGTNAASMAEGFSESIAVFGQGSLQLTADAQSSAIQQSDAIALYLAGLSSFGTAFLETSSIAKSSVFGSFNDLSFSGGASSSLATSSVKELAIAAEQLILLDDDQSPEGGSVDSRTSTSISDTLLTSSGRSDFFANSLSELISQSTDEMVSSKSDSTAIGVSFSDVSAAFIPDNSLTIISKAAFLNVGFSESFADFVNADNQMSSSNGVQTIVFGYTEAVIVRAIPEEAVIMAQAIPEPGTLRLFLAGTAISLIWQIWKARLD